MISWRGIAHAKVNLCLHITGRREDEYHLLESLVMFADKGDVITLTPSMKDQFHLVGPYAAAIPADAENLAWKALEGWREAAGESQCFTLLLEKNLPIEAGIGGGSSDAALVLKLLQQRADNPLPADVLSRLAVALGADVPVCLYGRACVMRGIGERIEPIEAPTELPALLINPGVSVSTPAAFAWFREHGSFSTPRIADMPDTLKGLPEWFSQTQNALEAAAIALAPEIGALLEWLADQPEALTVRMSGSGATCFAIAEDRGALDVLSQRAKGAFPSYWQMATLLR